MFILGKILSYQVSAHVFVVSFIDAYRKNICLVFFT